MNTRPGHLSGRTLSTSSRAASDIWTRRPARAWSSAETTTVIRGPRCTSIGPAASHAWPAKSRVLATLRVSSSVRIQRPFSRPNTGSQGTATGLSSTPSILYDMVTAGL